MGSSLIELLQCNSTLAMPEILSRRAVSVAPRAQHAFLPPGLQGEMSATVMRFPGEYQALVGPGSGGASKCWEQRGELMGTDSDTLTAGAGQCSLVCC